MKKIFVIVLLISVFTLTACNKKNNVDKETNNSSEVNNSVEENVTDYSGLYKSDDSSEIRIKRDYKKIRVYISIVRLASFNNCSVYEIKDDVLYISGKDPNGGVIKFTFDYNTKILTVIETSWGLLNVNDNFTFDK